MMTKPVPKRRMRADAERNRAKVLAAAADLLAREGEAASMRDIARQAGVGLATIYRQFPTKQALFEAIVVERVERLVDHATAAAEAKDPGGAFFEFFTFAVAESTGEKALVEALMDAGVDYNTCARAAYEALETAAQVLLQRAQQADAVRADVCMNEFVALITAICSAADWQHWDDDRRTRVLAVIFDGLRPQAS